MKAKNPAIVHYEFWDNILNTYERTTCAYGPPGWAITKVSDEIHNEIHFGQIGYGGGVISHWRLRVDGAFQWGIQHGAYRRRLISLGVPFLSWGWVYGRYQWLVDFDQEKKHRSMWSPHSLTDWQEPREYISEDLLGCRTYGQARRWCVLEQTGNGWKIALDPSDPYNNEDAKKAWRKYELLVEKRYQRLKCAALGVSPPVSARTPSLRSGGNTLSADQSITRLAALLEIHQPAKTTPLRRNRPKEALNGNNLDPVHSL